MGRFTQWLNSNLPRTGRMIKENGGFINEADGHELFRHSDKRPCRVTARCTGDSGRVSYRVTARGSLSLTFPPMWTCSRRDSDYGISFLHWIRVC